MWLLPTTLATATSDLEHLMYQLEKWNDMTESKSLLNGYERSNFLLRITLKINIVKDYETQNYQNSKRP